MKKQSQENTFHGSENIALYCDDVLNDRLNYASEYMPYYIFDSETCALNAVDAYGDLVLVVL